MPSNQNLAAFSRIAYYICRMVLRGQALSKNYGPLAICRQVEITVDQGELVTIVGPSGAGKSTLLQILGTLDRPDAGTLEILEKNPFLLSAKDLATFRNQHIGFVFQFHHLLPEFTAMENVSMPGWIAKRKDAEVKKRATELLERLGLKERLHHKPTELSGGEQQRAAVARALMNKPAIVLADEPSGNLDTHNANDLHHIFLELKKEMNQTFVVVTHNPSFTALADRVLVMKDGLLTEQPQPDVI